MNKVDLKRKNLLSEETVLDYLNFLKAPDGTVYASDTKFHRLFGRDSVFTCLEFLPWESSYALSTLKSLASLQKSNGQIIHETIKTDTMWDSVDSTPLFLILAYEYFKQTNDTEFIKSIFPYLEKSVSWMEKSGDQDQDYFLEYYENGKGLTHHCWKDSGDGMTTEEGKVPKHPIAPAEVQGYQYRALLGMAKIYTLFNNPGEARRLETRAAKIKELFNKKYWIPEQKFYSICLDGNKEKVSTVSSNIGHVLWSGIIQDDRIETIVKRLMSEEILTKYGLRTLSDKMGNFDPFSYHNGSIWPFDNWVFVEGLAKYGYKKEANQVREAVLNGLNKLGYPYECYTFYKNDLNIRLHKWDGSELLPERIQAWTIGAIYSFLKRLQETN